MANEEIKNRILMEMNEELTDGQLRKLKMCLDRNFYNGTFVENSTDIIKVEAKTNEQMLAQFVFDQKLMDYLIILLSNTSVRQNDSFLLLINNMKEVSIWHTF